MHSTTSLCINFIVCIFILVQVYSGAKRGTVNTVALFISYIGGIILCKPVSYAIFPFIKAPAKQFIDKIVFSARNSAGGPVSTKLFEQYGIQLALIAISYILAVVLIRIVLYMLHTTEKLPGIKEGSHILSGCLGLFEAIFLIWIFSLVLQMLGGMGIHWAKNLNILWESSVIIQKINEINILKLWIK